MKKKLEAQVYRCHVNLLPNLFNYAPLRKGFMELSRTSTPLTANHSKQFHSLRLPASSTLSRSQVAN
jgi:hypothetical protein